MKSLIAATLLLGVLALPAAAQEGDRSRSTSERLERLLQQRQDLERLERPSRHRIEIDRGRGYPHRSIRRDGVHRDYPYGRRSVFGLSDERGVIIFSPDRTLIIRQRDRDERRDLIRLDPAPTAPNPLAPDSSMLRRQQQPPRLLHGETITPFSAQVYATVSLAGYEGPSDVYPVIARFSPGQVVTAIQSAGGADGVQWYLVASDRGQYAWVRGNRLAVEMR